MPTAAPQLRHEAQGIARYLLRWVPLTALVGLMAGTASALLLWSLDLATRLRENHLWLIALLPIAGLAIGVLYRYYGAEVEAGNNLILDEIHAEVAVPARRIWLRMTPLILLATFFTHLCGGSAGREGTALQTGASLADQLAAPFKLIARDRRVLLMCGVSAGFASVFGTPLAGAVFGMEVLITGMVTYEAVVPCFLAAFVGDMVTHAWHIQHTHYLVDSVPALHTKVFLLAAVAGAVFGLAARAFALAAHAVGNFFCARIRWSPLRPFVGGVIIALAVAAVHTTRYIGLGIPTTLAAFHGTVHAYDWAGKFAFTVMTLSSGLKGGEVTPLFFIGATLGNALSHVLALPPSLLAGMGFAAVFAGAANTPIAASLMAMELFGSEAGAYAAIACVFSYLFSGPNGIYGAQRKPRAKFEV